MARTMTKHIEIIQMRIRVRLRCCWTQESLNIFVSQECQSLPFQAFDMTYEGVSEGRGARTT